MTPLIQTLDGVRSLLPVDLIAEREAKPCASPRTTEQVAAVTRYANQHNLSIEIVGAGTKRTWGNPIATDTLLETTRLTGVISHSWQDLTATVAAGTPWSTMQRILATHNQQVALDPLWPETATVGGIIATNDSGALRHKYGSLRDLIIGMTIVLADGTIAKSGGKVVKNVAGYDLHKLMTGAFGTLGIITEVTFRLHPIPHHAQTFTISAPQAAQLTSLIQSIRASHLLTQALQLRGDANGFHLDIQLNAHPNARQSEILQDVTEAAGLKLNGSQAEALAAREALFRDGATIVKLSVLPTELCQYLDHMQWAPEVEVACVAQSSGLIFAALEGPPAAIESYIQSVKTDLTILASSTNVPRWKADPSALPLMREIKHRFDPNRILNPGRFLGGI
jgi:glycolate oxidase FAD binding subunit